MDGVASEDDVLTEQLLSRGLLDIVLRKSHEWVVLAELAAGIGYHGCRQIRECILDGHIQRGKKRG